MNLKEKRHYRILPIYAKAITGKYDWKQLKEIALKIPVSNHTADDYMDEIKSMLIKAGYIKDE